MIDPRSRAGFWTGNRMSTTPTERSWVPLVAKERRVLGVLVEKQKTTPEYYPMTISALVNGCNQKTNRDPLTQYDADDVEETLHELRQKGAVMMVEGSGRVARWRHALYDWLGLKGRAAEMAVLAELMLRGPQTEGELRQRASRMTPIADLTTLQTILHDLDELGLVVTLTPAGQRRGVIVTHGLYPTEELNRLRSQVLQNLPSESEGPTTRTTATTSAQAVEIEALRSEVQELREQLQAVEADLQALKQSLGA